MQNLSRTQINDQHFNEIYGQVIGLHGDPTNQNSSITGGVTLAQAYNDITWSDSDTNKSLFWSRVLLCAILNPNDSNNIRAKIALVLKPRSLWLFKKGVKITDYVDNEVPEAQIGTANTDGLITSINPTYNFGDIIRIGTLPYALSVSNWSDGFTKLYSEYYDTQVSSIRDASLVVSSMTIKAKDFIPTLSNFTASKIVYYDKNVDARTRIVGGSSGATVTIPLCFGGVTSIYQLKGTKLS